MVPEQALGMGRSLPASRLWPAWWLVRLSQAEKISSVIFNCFDTKRPSKFENWEGILCPVKKSLA